LALFFLESVETRKSVGIRESVGIRKSANLFSRSPKTRKTPPKEGVGIFFGGTGPHGLKICFGALFFSKTAMAGYRITPVLVFWT
jgi:hypothetical protein